MNRKFVAVARALIFGLVGMMAASSPAQTPHTQEHRFSGAEHWARVFDDPARDEWQKPHEVIQALSLAPNAVVADVGAGTGYFSVRLAHFVPKGQVYGVDVEPDMVNYLAERAKRDGLANVTAVAGKRDDPRLPAKVDLAMMVDVYHHVADRSRYFSKLRSSLKPGGRVAIIDFKLDSPMGPPASERITPDRVKAELSSAGYVLAEEHGFLRNQYFLIFRVANP